MPPALTPGSTVSSLKETVAALQQRTASALYNWLNRRDFNPNVPIEPQTRIEEQTGGPRITQYPISSNLLPRPRSERSDLTPFDQLRNLARMYDVAAICIDTMVGELRAIDWAIGAKDPKKQKMFEEAGVIRSVTRFFERPNRREFFSDWIARGTRDVLEIDALSIYPRRNRGGGLYSLEIIDGASIKPLLDDRGLVFGYQQNMYGIPFSQYNIYQGGFEPHLSPLTMSNGEPVQQELIYRPRNVRTDTPYGLSPTEYIILRMNMALRKQSFDLAWFTDGNVPDMLLAPPADKLNPEQVAAFEEYFNALLTGNDAARRKVRFTAWPTQATIMKSFEYNTVLDEYMLKIACAAYGVTPAEIGFTNDVNKATSQGQENVQYRRGIRPLAQWWKELFDWIIDVGLNQPELEWKWNFGEAEDNLTQAQQDDIYIKDGVLSPDEVRRMRFSGKVEGKAPGAQQAPAPGGDDGSGTPPPTLPAPAPATPDDDEGDSGDTGSESDGADSGGENDGTEDGQQQPMVFDLT